MAKRKREKKKKEEDVVRYRLEKTNPIDQIVTLTKLSRACIACCEANTLLKSTWVERSFADIANQLDSIWTMLRMNEIESNRKH